MYIHSRTDTHYVTYLSNHAKRTELVYYGLRLLAAVGRQWSPCLLLHHHFPSTSNKLTYVYPSSAGVSQHWLQLVCISWRRFFCAANPCNQRRFTFHTSWSHLPANVILRHVFWCLLGPKFVNVQQLCTRDKLCSFMLLHPPTHTHAKDKIKWTDEKIPFPISPESKR